MISIDISMVVVIINFLLLLFILKVVAFEPIKNMISEIIIKLNNKIYHAIKQNKAHKN
jgi:F0F1-type ATP synthase membrane subunit b/b'